MSTTRKQIKARKSRGAEMLSDIENLDIMLGGNHLEREGIEYRDSNRKPGCHSYNTQKTTGKIVTLILGKMDEVTVPVKATTQLAQTLVLSLIDYQASSI